MNPPKDIERFNTAGFDYRVMKEKISRSFHNNIFNLFNALGGVDLSKLGSIMSASERESRQYISYNSLYKNMDKIFGIKNKFFSEMLFEYLSKNAPKDHKINFY